MNNSVKGCKVMELKNKNLCKLKLDVMVKICNKYNFGLYFMGFIIPQVYHLLTDKNQENVFYFICKMSKIYGNDIIIITEKTLEEFDK